MKRKSFLIGLLTLASVTAASILALVPITKNKDEEAMTWMSKVNDEVNITELSIPGTHDSGATRSIFDVSGKCQDTSIETQLNIGVRFFDLRLQLVDNEFRIVHSFVDQKLLFKDVMEDMHNFLSVNSSEFLLVSIKEEASSKNSNIGFEEALLNEMKPFESVISYSNTFPEKVKDARGKLHIISRFNSSIGVNAYEGWLDSTSFEMREFYVQDNYAIESEEEKIEDIKKTMEYSNNNKDKLVLNFTSCYLKNNYIPPLYAGTPALAINPWLEYQLKTNNNHVGVMVMDFVTLDLCKLVYRRNL